MLMGPTVAMMHATCIVQDEATGASFMDMVTASVGRVALGNPHMVANFQGTHHGGHHQPLFREQRQMASLKQSNYGSSHQHGLRLCKFIVSVSIRNYYTSCGFT